MNVNRSNERKFSHTKKPRSRQYSIKAITDPDNGGDIAFLADTTVLVEYLLNILEEVAKCIGLFVNLDKTDFLSFKQDSAIFT